VAPRCGARTEVIIARALSAPTLRRLRGGKNVSLGLVLALLALLAQITGAGFHHPALPAAAKDPGKLAITFGAHALCLAAESAEPGRPGPVDEAPGGHHDFAACCVWHGVTGAVLAQAALVEPLTFVSIRVAFASPSAEIPTRKRGSTRARAPPVRAKHLTI